MKSFAETYLNFDFKFAKNNQSGQMLGFILMSKIVQNYYNFKFVKNGQIEQMILNLQKMGKNLFFDEQNCLELL